MTLVLDHPVRRAPRAGAAQAPALLPPPRAPVLRDGLGGLPPLPGEDSWRGSAGRGSLWKGIAAPILGGSLGALLLTTALTGAIQGRFRTADRAVVSTTSAPSRERAGRGDALVARHVRPVQDRQVFVAPFTQTVNGQDLIRTARFLHLHAGLSTGGDEAGVDVPEALLDAILRPNVRSLSPEDPLAASAGEDADVKVTHRPLDPDSVPDDPPAAGGAISSAEEPESAAEGGEPVLSDALAADEVRAFEQGQATRFPWLGAGGFGASSSLLDGPGEGTSDAPFSGMSVRFIPENVITRPRGERRPVPTERMTIEANRPLAEQLTARGLPPGEAAEAARLLLYVGIQPGRSLDVEAVPVEGSASLPRIERLSAEIGGTMVPVVARNDRGRFVPVPLPALAPATGPQGEDDGPVEDGGEPLYRSLYVTARNAGLSHGDSLDLIRLFASDFDLEQGTTRRDVIDVLGLDPAEDKSAGTLLSVQLTAAGTTRRYFRSLDGLGGDLAFVDAEGRSFHAALDTKPVLHARLTSTFGGRYHPILHYTRPHNGIDWAAKIGTPILAAGDGDVTEAGPRSGYGRHVEIRHADGYVTTYSHMDRIARDIVVGRHVARGEVIGFLGQSGLATGPHLHFEYKLNGIFVDPLTVKVPRARLTQREAGPRFAAWVQQLQELASCGPCEGR